MNEDIIVAIATSRLEAAISMIRVSGPDCIAFVQKFFTGKIIEKPSVIRSIMDISLTMEKELMKC